MSIDPNVLQKLSSKEKPDLDGMVENMLHMIDEYVWRIRDAIDNGGREEVAGLVSASDHITELMYVVEKIYNFYTLGGFDKDYLSNDSIERIADHVVAKQAELNKNKVYAKLQEQAEAEVAAKVTVKKAAKDDSNTQ